MKFAEHLSAHITPEWRKQYIEYEKMKQMLYDAREAAPADEETDPSLVERYKAQFHEKFFRFCELELKKINIFFSEKLSEAMRKMASLKADLEQRRVQEKERNLKRNKGVTFQAKTQHDLRLAFSEFYLSLVLLQNYQTLNFTGFRKILKKHDKLFDTKSGCDWRHSQVETSLFFISKEVNSVIEEVENIVTADLESGDRGRAMKRLRVPPLGETQNPWTTFRLGLFLGISIVLFVIAVIAAFFIPQQLSWQHIVRLYRGPLLVIMFCYLIGGNTYGWRTSGVNHVLIFELDPRHHLTYQQFLEVAGCFAVIWGGSLILFLFSPHIGIPYLVNPLWMAIVMFLYLANPLPVLHYRSRRWLLDVLFRIITAPFHFVHFKDFWLADQLNSLVLVLQDFQYLLCFYAFDVEWNGPNALQGLKQLPVSVNNGTNITTVDSRVCLGLQYGIRPLVAVLPSWFRFAQCWRRYRDTKHAFPHVANAFKYSTSFFVVIFSALNEWYAGNNPGLPVESNMFFWLWLASAVVSSCYTYTWDIKMDWGLFHKNAGENRFLREETVYRYKAYYYFAIVEDLILRFTWTITMSMTISPAAAIDNEALKTVLGILEVLRRCVWNFFRLENEHLNNIGEFRAVRDISITPIDHSDQLLLEKMMDEEDGVLNRREKDAKRGGLRWRDPKTWFSEDDDEQPDTWSTFKGSFKDWLQSKKEKRRPTQTSADLEINSNTKTKLV